MKLSILILTLPTRKDKLERLLSSLKPQLTADTEIWINYDERVKTIGQKRNELLDLARGEFVAYIDDDDEVSSNYVKSIEAAISNNPHTIGFKAVRDNQGGTTEYTLSAKNKDFHKQVVEVIDGNKVKKYQGMLTHLCPVRKEIADAIRFPLQNYGEDTDYGRRLRDHLKANKLNKTIDIDEILYHYHFNPHKSY